MSADGTARGRGLQWALVAGPDDPVVASWLAAAEAAGIAPPRIVPWAEVLDGRARFAEGELVHAERLTATVPLRYGGSRNRYETLAQALGVLDSLLADSGAEATAETASILLALDRKQCTEHLGAAGVPVPKAGGTVVRQRFAEPFDAVSNVAGNIGTSLSLIRTREGFELQHRATGQYYRATGNDDSGVAAQKVEELLTKEDETYAVKDLPTAYLNNAQHRFRFAVVDGRVTHAVGRPENSRPAREYFGGRRREIDAYQKRFGAAAWQDLISIAERAAAAFPGLRSLGVDLAPDQTGRPDLSRGQPTAADLEAAEAVWRKMAANAERAGLTLPPMPRADPRAVAVSQVANDLVYDIDPFGARLPGALGLPGTAGEGWSVPATVLRGWWAARQSS